MKQANSPTIAGQPGSYRKTVLSGLLIACMAAAPVAAQQSAAGISPAVPDNVAPHAAPVQPLPFSHRTHLNSGLDCDTCHTNPDPGTLMGFPDTETCTTCHRIVAKDKPAIARLLEYSASGQPIPWVRVYSIASEASWSHRVHLQAGTQCETCHGNISEVETVAETKAVRAMAACISCHQAREAPTECVACHAWPTDRLLGIHPETPDQ